MQLKSRSAVILILGIFWGVIGLSMITGNWQTKASSEEVVVNSPSDLKGWMTLTDVSGYFKVPVPELAKIFGLPSDVEPDKPLKEIAQDSGKETDDLREILSNYLGVAGVSGGTEPGGGVTDKAGQTQKPISSETGTSGSTQIDINVPEKTGNPDGSEMNQTPKETDPEKQVKPIQPQDSNAGVPLQVEQPAETPGNADGGSGDGQVIKGKMTLSEVEFITKVPASYICRQLGIPETVDRGTALRDLGSQFGFEVDSVRDIVANYKP